MVRCIHAAFFVLLVPAAALGQVDLKWKFKPGGVFYMKTDTQRQSSIKVGEGETKTPDDQTLTFRMEVLEVATNGNAIIQQKVIAVEKKGGPASEAAHVAKMKGAEFKVTFTPKMKLVKYEGYDAFIDKLAGGNAVGATVMKNILTKDAVEFLLAHSFGLLPDDPVSVGDTWQRDAKVPLGPIGVAIVKRTVTYRGPAEGAKGLHKLEFTGDISFTPAEKPAPGISFHVIKADLKTKRCKGELLFDNDAGRLVKATLDSEFEGPMTMKASGQEIEMHMHSIEKTVAQISDKDPTVE